MEAAKLTSLIEQLHTELADHQIDDAQIQEQLRTLLSDVDKQVNDAAPAADESQQLSNIAVLLEAEFPRVSSTIREVIDQLGKLGI